MSFWKVIRGLEFRQVKSLAAWFLKHPLFMTSTIIATFSTYRISQREFPYIHGQHNKANAFRHALWNILIAKASSRFSKNQEAVLQWTQRITDWHEDFSPNEEMAKLMDLHNNRIGRDLFDQLSKKNTSEIIAFMKEQLPRAAKVQEPSEFDSYIDQLVYLED